ncbi:MAG: hypothetical protein DHS20C19_02610 [Acidimicrobiales bacterium]|nr:MAG: hypothetical protein DHS20C19_02610 [Acidimicrobiales bacterium]
MRSTSRSTRLTRLVAPVVFVSVLVAACGDATEITVDAEPAPSVVTTVTEPLAPATPPVVPIVVADYLVDGLPFPVPPGAVTLELTNNGEDFHHLQIWQVDDADAAAVALEAGDLGALQGGVAVGGVGAIEGFGTVGRVSTTLDPGEYVLFCVIHTPAGAHNELGMVARLDVAGEPIAVDLPDTAHRLQITPYGFQLPEEWDGRQPLSVVNALEWAADAEFLRLADGATRDDFLAFMDGSRPGPPPFTVAGGVAGLGSNRAAVVLDPLEPGDYLVVSFSPDPAADMAPQFTTGLLTELTIR